MTQKPRKKRQRFQQKKKIAIGIVVWNLNSANPINTPARNSVSRSRLKCAPEKSSRSKIESCPCIKATPVGMNEMNIAKGSGFQTADRFMSRGRNIRNDKPSNIRFNARKRK